MYLIDSKVFLAIIRLNWKLFLTFVRLNDMEWMHLLCKVVTEHANFKIFSICARSCLKLMLLMTMMMMVLLLLIVSIIDSIKIHWSVVVVILRYYLPFFYFRSLFFSNGKEREREREYCNRWSGAIDDVTMKKSFSNWFSIEAFWP